jgi:hypothetical protein
MLWSALPLRIDQGLAEFTTILKTPSMIALLWDGACLTEGEDQGQDGEWDEVDENASTSGIREAQFLPGTISLLVCFSGKNEGPSQHFIFWGL